MFDKSHIIYKSTIDKFCRLMYYNKNYLTLIKKLNQHYLFVHSVKLTWCTERKLVIVAFFKRLIIKIKIKGEFKMSIHVTPKNGKWQVKTAGGEKAYRIVDTQKEAIEIATQVAKNQQTDVKIHSKTGAIRKSENYASAKKTSTKKTSTKTQTKKKIDNDEVKSTKTTTPKNSKQTSNKTQSNSKEKINNEVVEVEEKKSVEKQTSNEETTKLTRKQIKEQKKAEKQRLKEERKKEKAEAKAKKLAEKQAKKLAKQNNE